MHTVLASQCINAIKDKKSAERGKRRLPWQIDQQRDAKHCADQAGRHHPLELAAIGIARKARTHGNRRRYIKQHAHREHKIERIEMREYWHCDQCCAECRNAEHDESTGDDQRADGDDMQFERKGHK